MPNLVLPATASPIADYAGMTGSTLCIAHCALTPIILAIAPIVPLSIIGGEAIHTTLVVAVAGIATFAFGFGYRVHRDLRLPVLAAAALGILAIAAFAPEGMLNETGEAALTIAGGGIMIFAHWFNRLFCRTCQPCREQECCGAG
jgi:hypothetical protein